MTAINEILNTEKHVCYNVISKSVNDECCDMIKRYDYPQNGLQSKLHLIQKVSWIIFVQQPKRINITIFIPFSS